MILRRRREDARVQGNVKTRSCPSTTIDSARTISISVALTVARSIAFRTSFSLGRYLRLRADFMLRDRVVATSAAVADVTAADRVYPRREMRSDCVGNQVLDLRRRNADDRSGLFPASRQRRA
jgi:hypothetical protein